MSIRDELLAIKGSDQLLQVDNVIVQTRGNPEQYPDLHNRLFSRTDQELAEDQRRYIVRHLISVHIVNAESGYREMISISTDRVGPGGGYRNINDVLPVVDLREQMLADALKDIDRLQLKYNKLHELAEVWAEAEKVRAKTTRRRGRRARAEPRTEA